MDIIVPFGIRKRELDGEVSDDAKKIFEKIKEKPDLATGLPAKGLPERTTLHKVYATTASGARRLLFFCRHSPPPTTIGEKPPPVPPERWVLLFYRTKSDEVGANMSQNNSEFVSQLGKNLKLALNDLTTSTPETPRYEQF